LNKDFVENVSFAIHFHNMFMVNVCISRNFIPIT
jgi:hypothetical protein